MPNFGIAPQTSPTQIRVLLIEDSPEDAQLVVRKLERGGYKVVSRRVDTPSDISDSITENWELIICDYTLPHFSGYDALTLWRERKCTAPFIFISGTLGEQQAVEALKQGASDYLLKNNLTRLIPAVERALKEVRDREEREQERARSEQSLRASEARFRALIENSSDGILVLDQKGRVLFASSAVQQILGYQSGEIADSNFFSLAHPDDRYQAVVGLAECSPRQVMSHLLRVRHKDGSWRVTNCVYSNLLEEPTVGGIIVNFRDVTEAHLAEYALRKSEEKFSKAFRSSPLAVTISTKEEGRYLDVNEAFLRMLRYRRSEVIGQSSLQLGIWTNPEERDALLSQLGTHLGVTGVRANFKTKTGEIRETVIAAEPIELDGIPCVLAITQDITETRRLEAQFRQAQKMEAVGQLAGGVAHDFNNLLMVMRGYAQMLVAENPGPKVEEYTNRIIEAADKAAGVTRQLLAFSRQQPQELKTLDLNRVVRNFCTMLPGLLGEDIQLQFSTNARSGEVFADQGQLEQVIMNLAVNARDAMPDGGRLTIETEDIKFGEGIVEHHGTLIPPGSYIMLSVADTGEGMPEETKTKLFEPFFTTKGPGKGTGLGLATVYGIVKQHNGFIWVYSEFGLGTIFKIYLPECSQVEDAKIEPAKPLSARAGGYDTILIVEDQPALLEVTAKYLSSIGYTVLKACDGESAMKATHEHVGPIDLLLTDVVMPGMPGPELAGRLQILHPEMHIVYMSGYPDRKFKGSESGPLIHKPIDLGILAQHLARVLKRTSS